MCAESECAPRLTTVDLSIDEVSRKRGRVGHRVSRRYRNSSECVWVGQTGQWKQVVPESA